MPIYAYTAVNAAGDTSRGQLEAPSEQALEARLRQQGQWLAEAVDRQIIAATGGARIIGNHHVPRRVLIDFFLQLGIQLKAGVPIFTALAFGVNENPNLTFQAVQRDLVTRLQGGSSLADALAAHPRTFGPLVINLVRAGERSGQLAEMCREIRQHYEWLDRLAADIRQATLYPLFVLAATIGFVLLMFTFLVPRFAAMLKDLNLPLPPLTLAVLGISEFLVHHGPWLLGGTVAAVFAFRLALRRLPEFAYGYDRWKFEIPVFGALNRMICLARFAQNLAILYRAGISLIEALQLVRSLVGNRVLERAVADIQAGVKEGRQISAVMSRHEVFSRLLVQMVSVGESSGSLSETLQNVSDYYNEILPRQVKKLFTILEPVMIVFLIALVGTVALAIFLPIISLMNLR